MKLVTAIENGFINKEVQSLIDTTTCEYCGEELEVDYGMDNIYCSNIQCEMNLALRIMYFLDLMIDITIPVERILEFIRDNNIKQLSEIWYVQDFEDSDIEDCMEELTLNIKEVDLYKILEAMTINEIHGIEKKLLFNYNSIDKFFEDVKLGGIAYICGRLGYVNEAEVLSVRIYDAFIRNENDIKEMCSNFKIKGSNRKIARVCLDGINVGDMNSSLIQVNNILNHISIVVSNVLTINTDLLLSSETSSEKYEQANRLNTKLRKDRPIKCLNTIEELVSYIQKL